jgi:hypothetical protein
MLLAALLLGLAFAPIPQPPAAASCVGPTIRTEGLDLRRGESATIAGESFVDGCRDTMTCSGILGCSRCEYTDPPPQPMRDVALRLEQGRRSWTLGTVDADDAGEVAWVIVVPEDARPGPARLVVDGNPPERVRIR